MKETECLSEKGICLRRRIFFSWFLYMEGRKIDLGEKIGEGKCSNPTLLRGDVSREGEGNLREASYERGKNGA